MNYFYFISETSPFNSPEDRTTVTNADFIQTGLINLKSQFRDDFCLQTMYPEAVVRTNSNEDFQILQEISPTTLMEESMPLIFSECALTELSNVPLDVNIPLDSHHHHLPPPDKMAILTRNVKPEEPSELANILTRGPGQYILDKRQDSSPKTLTNLYQLSSVKQSVIVPTLCFVEDKSLNDPTTSQMPNEKRNLKRKYEKGKDSSPKQSGGSNENFQKVEKSFQKLQQMIPGFFESSVKISKAAQLMKAADQIKSLKHSNDNLEREIDLLKSSNEDLMKSISSFQTQLSTNGTSI